MSPKSKQSPTAPSSPRKPKKPSVTKAVAAQLIVRAGHIGGKMHANVQGRTTRVGELATIATSAAIEHVFLHVLKSAARVTEEYGKKRIGAREVFLAVNLNDSLKQVFKNCEMVGGGQMPSMPPPAEAARLKRLREEFKTQ